MQRNADIITSFDDQVKSSYAFNSSVYDNSDNWKLVRSLYYKNYHKSKKINNIPKIIHQIWLGSPVPEQYMKFMWSWKKFHPTWEYKLWTDKDVNEVYITKKDVFNKATNPAMKSDILRYEILRQYGGLYVDTDFECLKSFDDLMYLDFFIGVSYDAELVLYTGLIASIPKYPVMNSVVNIQSEYNGNKGSIILDTTGAYHFTRCFTSVVNKNTERIVAFPTDYFYAFPNNMRKENINPYDYIKSYSYALHHWAVSWVKNKRYV